MRDAGGKEKKRKAERNVRNDKGDQKGVGRNRERNRYENGGNYDGKDKEGGRKMYNRSLR